MYNRWVRLSILVVMGIILFILAFKATPSLDGNKAAWYYRFCVAMFWITSIGVLLFDDSIGLFPLGE